MKRLALILAGGGLLAFACSNDEPASSTNTTSTNTNTSSGGAGGGTSSSSVTNSTSNASTTGEAGSPSTTTGAGGMPEFVAPEWLSETGLYEADMQTLAAGVEPFQPQFALWSDSAAKQRWVKLPAGAQIDTSEMDYWVYPVGTKLFKEFTRDGVRVETRLLQKVADGQWFMRAFQWNDDQTDAEARPNGFFDASGTNHDIPSENQCINCHDKMPDVVLGFSALQLSHDGDGVTLDRLVAEGRLSNAPSEPIVVPGNDTERAALGYLHANCGNCHQPRSFVSATVNMQLWLPSDALGSVAETPTVLTTVGRRSTVSISGAGGEGGQASFDTRIVAGDADSSVLYLRMSSREIGTVMPPVGTELVDEVGSGFVRDFINAMPPE